MINEQVLLKDILIKDDLKDFLYTNYNALGSLIKRPLTTEYAEAIALIITQRFAIFENCPTVYETVDTGIAQIHNFIKTINLFALVNEIRNSIDSFNTDAGKLHRQSKFNPIDNDNIDDAPIEIDDTEFTQGQT
ncbi:MAG: hypothetical protein HUJ68_04235 [Clostridia bacterium]|nr:hypothetical protein [Clostridia bacterium]